jgi:hypothetical protein
MCRAGERSRRLRQRDRERRAGAERRADPDVAAVGADHLVDDREAQAGAVGAGGEERLEDPRQVVGADPSAPGRDALAALSTRLVSTWRSRCGSPCTVSAARSPSRPGRAGSIRTETPRPDSTGVRLRPQVQALRRDQRSIQPIGFFGVHWELI